MKGSEAYVKCFKLINQKDLPDNIEMVIEDMDEHFQEGESKEELYKALERRRRYNQK